MKKRLALAALLVVGGLVMVHHGTARADCVSRTAWFGAEENGTRHASRTVTWSIPGGITVTSVTLSASLAPFGGGFNEALYLVGYSAPGKEAWQGIDSADPAFGPSNGWLNDFHGNQPQDSVLASAILKSTQGLAANQALTVATNTQIPPGWQLFLDMAQDGPAISDFEAQVEVSYSTCAV